MASMHVYERAPFRPGRENVATVAGTLRRPRRARPCCYGLVGGAPWRTHAVEHYQRVYERLGLEWPGEEEVRRRHFVADVVRGPTA